MNYIDKPLVSDFAQLALDVYNDFGDNDLRQNEFNKSWIKIDQWPRKNDYVLNHQEVDYDINTGFYAAFYINQVTGVAVLSIRGTVFSETGDVANDGNFLLNSGLSQFPEAKQLFFLLRDYKPWSGIKNRYVCGHSLGGILAKMMAPVTGLDTIAFNSPGVKECLEKHHFLSGIVTHAQRVVTYNAETDLIGNFRINYRLGDIKIVPLIEEKKIVDITTIVTGIEKIFDDAKDTVMKKIEYHSIRKLYLTLKKGSFKDCRF